MVHKRNKPQYRGGKPLANPRHEAFARHYIELGTGRNAYVMAGYSARIHADLRRPSPADAAASRLLKHVRVQARIEGLRKAMAKAADITADSIATELEEARALALREGQAAAAVSATATKAKLVGLMIDRKETGKPGDFDNWTEDQLREYLAAKPEDKGNQDESESESLPVATAPGTSTQQ